MISITLPDGNIKAFDHAVSGLELAFSISDGLARNAVAMELDHRLVDLQTEIDRDASVRLVTTKDPQALEIMRHSAAHVMAQAILRIYKEAKLTIGPVVEDGFYYDIDMPPVSEEDFPRIEAEIQKIIKAKLPIRRREVTKAEALELYKNEPYKLEMIQELDEGTISVYGQGEFTDLCRGPHVPHTGFVKAIKLLKVSGAYWRADPSRAQLQRIYGTAFFDKKELDAYLHFLEEAKRRNHRKIGQALDLFSLTCSASTTKHRACPSFIPRAWSSGMRFWITGAASTVPPATWKPKPRSFSTASFGSAPATGPTTGRTCTLPPSTRWSMRSNP